MFKLTVLMMSLVVISRCNYPCQKNYISPVFIGYSQADIDTIVLRAYMPNDNFQHLIDTFIYNNCCATIYTTRGDTTVVYLNSSNPDHWISAGFDWQIYIPAKNKTVSITKIVSPET